MKPQMHREELVKSQESPSIIEGKLPKTPKRPPNKIKCEIIECGWNRYGYCKDEKQRCE